MCTDKMCKVSSRAFFFAVGMLLCLIADVFANDDTVVYRPNADGSGNSLWMLNHTQPAPIYLDGSPDSYLAWGNAAYKPLVGDVTGDGLYDIVYLANSSNTVVWSAGHTRNIGSGVGQLSNTIQSSINNGTWNNMSASFLADVTGDGIADAVYVGDSSGTFAWYAAHSTASGLSSSVVSQGNNGYGWGGTTWGDLALLGDWNGDDRKDATVFRNGAWYYIYSTASGLGTSSSSGSANFGQAGDVPLVGDFNGDGFDDYAVVRNDGNGNAGWVVGYNNHSGGINAVYEYGALGLMTDKFIIADINGDGRDDIGIYRDGYWAFSLTGASGIGTGGLVQQVMGQAGDIPLVGRFIDGSKCTSEIVGDINGDSKVDMIDLSKMAAKWLDDCWVEDCGCADLYRDGKVNLTDFSLLAKNWQSVISRVLFTESWNSGTINTGLWTVSGPGIVLADISGNGSDYALKLVRYSGGSAGVWGNHIFSNSTFPRGDNIRCTFRIWHTANTGSSCGPMGPWHRTQNILYASFEAIATHQWPALGLLEYGEAWTLNPSNLLSSLNAGAGGKWQAATSKQTSLLFRVTLGNDSGAAFAYSVDDGQTWVADGQDTRGLVENAWGYATSSTRDNYLGFGPYNGQYEDVYIDDIIVEKDPPPPPPLKETWDSGSIDTTKWTPINTNPSGAVLDIVESPAGSGDYALRMGSSDWGNWEVSIWSKASFKRGDNVRCTFDVWHDSANNSPSLLGWYGPWKNALGTQAWQNNEACVDHVWSGLRWAESGMNQNGPLLDITNLWQNAYGRENALKIRVTLGDFTGAKLEYSTNGGGTWSVAKASNDSGTTWHNVDTIYRPPMLQWNGITIGSDPNCFISFGSAGYHSNDLHTYIDNVIVEKDPTVKYSIGYIHPNATLIDIPPYQGSRYTDNVPNTVDLAENAKLAIHGLTAPLYAPGDYELYWLVSFQYNPTRMWFGEYTNINPKSFEALPLLRMMTGSTYNDQVDQVWMDMTLKSIGPEGLFYIATGGKSYILWDPLSASQIITPISLGRMTGALTNFYVHSGSSSLLTTATNLVNATNTSAIQKENGDRDWCHWPYGTFTPENLPFNPYSPVLTEMNASEVGGRVIQGPAQFYAATGYDPARQLARKCAIYMKDHSNYFDSSTGAWLGTWAGYNGPHNASHTKVLLSMLDYGLPANDTEFIDFVKKSYEWGRDHAASYKTIGWYPEIMDTSYPSTETCELADMLAIGVKMSAAGLADYWDDVDMCIRNQFEEAQLKNVDWVDAFSSSYPVTPLENASGKRGGTMDHVPQRNIGAWAAWSLPNSWGSGIMHCCTGNAARAMYHVWKDILSYSGGQLKVNLLLNRASPLVDIYSYIPYTGQVDIKIKQNLSGLSVRMPKWIASGSTSVVCKVNGLTRSFSWSGKYINIGAVSANDYVAITFPISESNKYKTLVGTAYTFRVKGTTVVNVIPAGTWGSPYYQRAYYRTGPTQWHEVERFIYSGLDY